MVLTESQMAAAVGTAGRVYAFEQFDANADLLEKSLHENRFDDRVVFRRAAVGADLRAHARCRLCGADWLARSTR